MSEDTRTGVINFACSCNTIRNKLVFGTTALTPVNFEEEKQKFFKSRTYNPVFHYRDFDAHTIETQIKQLKPQLDSLTLPHDLTLYLREYIQDLRLLLKARRAIGTDDFAYYTRKLFKYEEMSHKASKTLQSPMIIEDSADKTMYTAPEIAKIFEYFLHHQYGLPDFQVNVDEFNGTIICTGTDKINIGKNVKRLHANVMRLVVHEIESHALQFHNLSLHSNPFIRLTKYAESNLYSEGLAVYNEIQTNTITQKAYDEYWYRLKAVQMLDRSFRDIFNYISHYLPEKRAFQLTYRVKRGMKHTAHPGGFPKDASYLLGYHAIAEYIKAGLRPEFLYLSKSPTLTALLLRHGFMQKTNIKLPKFWNENRTTEKSQQLLKSRIFNTHAAPQALFEE